jgi:hypothetical protein
MQSSEEQDRVDDDDDDAVALQRHLDRRSPTFLSIESTHPGLHRLTGRDGGEFAWVPSPAAHELSVNSRSRDALHSPMAIASLASERQHGPRATTRHPLAWTLRRCSPSTADAACPCATRGSAADSCGASPPACIHTAQRGFRGAPRGAERARLRGRRSRLGGSGLRCMHVQPPSAPL